MIVAMEWLPHEVRILFDSVVVRRYPDRLLPPSSPYYNWVEGFGRAPVNVIPGEFDADDELVNVDSHGHPSSNSVYTQNWFLAHVGDVGTGYWNGAAHHRLDYVKVFEVPKNVIIPGFPQ